MGRAARAATIFAKRDRWPRSTGRTVHARTQSLLHSIAAGAALGAIGLVARYAPARSPVPPVVAVLVVKIPKTLALLEAQLRLLRPSLRSGSVVVAGAMTRHVHTSTIAVFEQFVGPVRTTPARRKARLLLAEFDDGLDPQGDTWPRSSLVVPGGSSGTEPVQAVQHAGVFAADGFDPGTRLLLEHLPSSPVAEAIVDLGCGNGIVGTTAARLHPEAAVTFADESDRAVASAEATFRANLGDDRSAEFVVADGLSHAESAGLPLDGSVDLVLLNPPFHRHHSADDSTAWRLFGDAHRVLRPGGELLVVGNRHLGYHARLRRRFGNSEVVASNPRFVLVRAIRRGR